MLRKVLFALAPLAANLAIGFVTGKTANSIDSKSKTKALALGLTFVVGGISFLASRELDKMFNAKAAPLLDTTA